MKNHLVDCFSISKKEMKGYACAKRLFKYRQRCIYDLEGIVTMKKQRIEMMTLARRKNNTNNREGMIRQEHDISLDVLSDYVEFFFKCSIRPINNIR